IGELAYRSLRFETEILDVNNYQGNAVVNYTEREIPFTRIIEHKHFENGQQENTVITREYPVSLAETKEPFYPINDEHNNKKYKQYREMAAHHTAYMFGGRLGDYKYYNMDDIVSVALERANKELLSLPAHI